jgi:hypothetical protein
MDDIVEHLLVALLAVNNWTVERVWNMRDSLRETGLTDLRVLSALSTEDVVARLVRAGHNRGDYMNSLMAERVQSMAEAFNPEALAELERHLHEDNRVAVDAILTRIRGVGPTVLRNFWVLRELPA